MSFDNNPFKNVHLHIEHDDKMSWHCDSCGADSDRHMDIDTSGHFTEYTELGDVLCSWYDHLRRSHHLSSTETERWADY